jgi:RNA polymerase sigma factor (sigma-70 family)
VSVGSNKKPLDNLTDVESRLIAHKAASLVRRRKVLAHDHDDVFQELAIAVLLSRSGFHSAKGSAEVFIQAVVRRAAAKFLRARRAAKRNPQRACSLETLPTLTSGQSEPALPSGEDGPRLEDLTNLTIDVAELLEQLPEVLREFAEALKSMPKSEVARQLGISRSEADNRLSLLRERFLGRGLKGCSSTFSVTSKRDG